MKTLRTQRPVTLLEPVTPSHPADVLIRFTDTGEERLMDVALIDYETPEERKAALTPP